MTKFNIILQIGFPPQLFYFPFFPPNVGCPICITSGNINIPTTVFKDINIVENCLFLSVSLFPIFPYLINRLFFFFHKATMCICFSKHSIWSLVRNGLCDPNKKDALSFWLRPLKILAKMMKNKSLLTAV